MKLASNWKTITPVTGVAALLLWGIAGQFKSEGAGSLTPPPGEPMPVMPSLAEIDDRLSTLGSNGRNFAVSHTTNRVKVWNSKTGTFVPDLTVNGLKNLVEDDGNFFALGSSSAAAWSKDSGTWTVVTGLPNNISQTATSNGNYCFLSTNKAYAWSRHTRSWAIFTINTPQRIEDSNGNFMVPGSAAKVAAWDQTTSTWSDVTVNNLIDIVSAED